MLRTVIPFQLRVWLSISLVASMLAAETRRRQQVSETQLPGRRPEKTGPLLGLSPQTERDGLISETRIAAFGAAKPLFLVYGGIENDKCRLVGGAD